MPTTFAIAAPGYVLVVIIVLIVLALVFYLVSTIMALRQITTGLDEVIVGVTGIIEKSAPVQPVVEDINANLDAAVSALEGLLVKKAGMSDAMGLLEGLYPGAHAAGLRDFPESKDVKAPRIGEVYTKGTLTLARLGREAPVAQSNPGGPAIRDFMYGSAESRKLYPEGRAHGAAELPRSPVIGSDAPVQYEQREDIGKPRKRLPVPNREE
jgi:hypothetical protein